MRTWVDDWGHTINIMFPKKNLVKLSLEDAKSLVSELEYQIKIAEGWNQICQEYDITTSDGSA